MQPIRIAVVGIGAIARDQHVPCIRDNPAYELVATVSRHSRLEGIRNFSDIADLLAQAGDVDAVALCTPPDQHYEAARLALQKRRHVLLEKPPCTSLSQLAELTALAQRQHLTLYQTWHSRHAAGVAQASQWLVTPRPRQVRRMRITWKEDVRRWHPGQRWLWQPGGFGVLDPGINALSIVTQLLSDAVYPSESVLYYPSNCHTPIAAHLQLRADSGAVIEAEFDFRHTGVQTWQIDIQTNAGDARLTAGGALFTLAGQDESALPPALHGEYPSIYRRFAQLVPTGASEVDARPLMLVADLLLIGRQIAVEPFDMSRP